MQFSIENTLKHFPCIPRNIRNSKQKTFHMKVRTWPSLHFHQCDFIIGSNKTMLLYTLLMKKYFTLTFIDGLLASFIKPYDLLFHWFEACYKTIHWFIQLANHIFSSSFPKFQGSFYKLSFPLRDTIIFQWTNLPQINK